MSYVITSDSSCDLSADTVKSLNVIPLFMNYTIDGEEFTDTMQPEDLREFYNRMVEGKMPRTAQVNQNDYISFWEPFLKDGKDIIHISLSSCLSGTYHNGSMAANELMEKYPDRKIEVIDTLMASTGNGLVIVKAAQLRDSGADFDEVSDWCKNNVSRVHAVFTTDDITYLQHGGRVSKTGMIISKALHIYPVLHVNSLGELKPFAKVRGVASSFNTIAKYIEDNCINPQDQTLYVSDALNPEGAKKLGDMLSQKFGFKDVFYSNIGTIIGAHAGPELLAVFFMGKER